MIQSKSSKPIYMIWDTLYGTILGILAGLMTLILSLIMHPLVAIVLPIVAIIGFAVAANPATGALFLILFAYLDGISDKIFAVSPISGFKLITAATVFGIAVTAYRNHEKLRAVFAAPITLWAIGFSSIWLIAILLAMDKNQAIAWGFRLGTIKVLFLLILMSLHSQKEITLGVHLLAFASAVSAVFLILDTTLGITIISTSEAATTARTAEGFERSSGGSQHNPTTAATMLLCGTIIALVHAIETPKRRILMAGFAFLGTAAVVLSFARSAALVYGIIALALAFRYRKHKFFAPVSILLFFAALAMIPFVPPTYFERITSIFGGGGGDWTLGRRLTYNVIGVDLLMQNPLIGIGPGNYKLMFTDPEYRYLPGRSLLGRQLHNMYLSVAVEYGLIGFFFFMGLITTAFKLCRDVMRSPANDDLRALATALVFGMAAYFIVSVFVPNEYNKYTWILPGLSGALFLLNARLLEGKQE